MRVPVNPSGRPPARLGEGISLSLLEFCGTLGALFSVSPGHGSPSDRGRPFAVVLAKVAIAGPPAGVMISGVGGAVSLPTQRAR